MNNSHLAGVPSGASGDPEKPTTAHSASGMQNISAISSSVCTICNLSCVTLIPTSQSSPLAARNGNILKMDSTWKVLQLRKLLRLPLVQRSDNTPQENHRHTMETQSLRSISHTPSRYLANQVAHNSSPQAQRTDIPDLLRILHKEATTVPPLSAASSRTLVKVMTKAIRPLDPERLTSLRANLGR
jgi:hypothetical protein